jgi:hypothetical protein
MTEHFQLKGQRTLPDIEGLGFKWKPLLKAIAKPQRLWHESREVNREFLAAEQEVNALESRSLGEMTDSILTGADITAAADALPAARARLENLRQRSIAYEGALERVHREIVEIATAHQEAFTEEVHAKAQKQLGEVEAAAAHLQQLVGGLYVLGAIGTWLENPKKSFSYRAPEPGLFENILAAAKESGALPREEGLEGKFIEHPGHAAPKGPVREIFAPFFGG